MEKQLIEALQKQVQLLEQLVRAKDQLILELQLKQIPQTPIYPQIVPQNPWTPWNPTTYPYIVTSLTELVQPVHRVNQFGADTAKIFFDKKDTVL